MRGETGIKLLQGRILDCLPKRDALLSVEESIGRLDVFSKSLVLGFCGRGISGQYDTVQTWLQTRRNGRCPVFGSGTDTGFMQQVQNRMNLYCTWKSSAGSSAPAEVLFGKEAVQKIIDELQAKVTAKQSSVGLPDVRSLHIFGWLLSAVQQDQVQRWTDAILSESGVAKDRAIEKRADPAAKRKKGAKNAPEPLESVVDGYFAA